MVSIGSAALDQSRIGITTYLACGVELALTEAAAVRIRESELDLADIDRRQRIEEVVDVEADLQLSPAYAISNSSSASSCSGLCDCSVSAVFTSQTDAVLLIRQDRCTLKRGTQDVAICESFSAGLAGITRPYSGIGRQSASM